MTALAFHGLLNSVVGCAGIVLLLSVYARPYYSADQALPEIALAFALIGWGCHP